MLNPESLSTALSGWSRRSPSEMRRLDMSQYCNIDLNPELLLHLSRSYLGQHVLERHLGCMQAQMGEGEEISEGNAGWIWGSFGILARIHSYDESQIQGFRFMMNLDPL